MASHTHEAAAAPKPKPKTVRMRRGSSPRAPLVAYEMLRHSGKQRKIPHKRKGRATQLAQQVHLREHTQKDREQALETSAHPRRQQLRPRQLRRGRCLSAHRWNNAQLKRSSRTVAYDLTLKWRKRKSKESWDSHA